MSGLQQFNHYVKLGVTTGPVMKLSEIIVIIQPINELKHTILEKKSSYSSKTVGTRSTSHVKETTFRIEFPDVRIAAIQSLCQTRCHYGTCHEAF